MDSPLLFPWEGNHILVRQEIGREGSAKINMPVNKWSTNREVWVQNFKKLVYVDCERPLSDFDNHPFLIKSKIVCIESVVT